MNYRKIVFIISSCLFIFIVLPLLSSQQQKPNSYGEVIYIEGDITIYRNGAVLSYEEVDFGFLIEEYDLVETGPDGYVEIDLHTAEDHYMSVTMQPETVFYFTFSNSGERSESAVEMLKGTLSFVTKKRMGGKGLKVKTPSVVAGVRGTEFTVLASPESSILITCVSGKVSCTGSRGYELFSEPGKAIEALSNGAFQAVEVSGNLENFITSWEKERITSFEHNAESILQHYFSLYASFSYDFQEAFEELEHQKKIFNKWMEYRDQRHTVPFNEATRDKMALSPGIIKLRSVFNHFEMLYYRILELKKLFEEHNVKRFKLTRKISSIDFLENIGSKNDLYRRQFGLSRQYLKIFKYISRSSSPFGEDGSDDLFDSIFSDTEVIFGNDPF